MMAVETIPHVSDLPYKHYDNYVEAVGRAQKFARMNREVMMRNLIAAVRTMTRRPFETHVEAVCCQHHYGQKEHHFGKDVQLTRKRAVSAREGELGIIPGAIDEIPMACKDIDAVMQAQSDLVEAVTRSSRSCA